MDTWTGKCKSTADSQSVRKSEKNSENKINILIRVTFKFIFVLLLVVGNNVKMFDTYRAF